jgi:hypothetical protein
MPMFRISKPRSLIRLPDISPEILGIIIEYLRSRGPHNLLNICLVSRGLYLYVVPYLYRDVKLDLGRSSHARLLQRLAEPQCRLAQVIRTVAITDTEKQDTVRWEHLYILFMSLRYLQEFDWNGPMAMPYFLLQLIASRHPQARLNITIRKRVPIRTSNGGLLVGNILAHPVGQQINAFYYSYAGSQSLKAGFKGNLLAFLTKKDTLTTLAIFNTDPEDIDSLPEMPEYFRNSSFPCIKQLVLHTTMFTARELSMWVSRGTWDHLLFLQLHHAHQSRTYHGLHL